MIPLHTPDVQPRIDGEPVGREDLIAWELEQSRRVLAHLRSKIGPTAWVDIISDDLPESDAMMTEWIAQSGGRLTPSTAEIVVRGGSAEDYMRWFGSRVEARDFRIPRTENPEHYAVLGGTDGIQAFETLGGLGLPARLLIQHGAKLTNDDVQLDTDYPVKLIAHITIADGLEFGWAVHQFRNTKDGFAAKLCVYFPAATDPAVVVGHQWHLATEFRIWITSYLASVAAIV